MLKRILKILAFLLSGIMVLVILLLILISTGRLNNSLAHYASKMAGSILKANLSLGKINGNLLGHFVIADILLTKDGDTLVYADTLEIDYRLFGLLRKEIEVRKIRLGRLNIHLEQEQDSLWNIMKILPATDTTKREQSDHPFAWEINLREIQIDSCLATIQPLDTAALIPGKVDFNLNLAMKMMQDSMVFHLGRMSLKTLKPNLLVKEMTGNFTYAVKTFSWKDFKIELANTLLQSEGTLPTENIHQLKAKTGITPLDFDDIRDWLSGAPVYGKPDIQVDLDGNIEKNNIFISLSEGAQSAEIRGWFKNLITLPEYDLTADFKQIDGFHWTHDSLFSSDITGQLQAEGKGFDPKTLTVKAKGDFKNITYINYKFNNTLFEITKSDSQAVGKLSSGTWFGQVASQFRLTDIFNEVKYIAQVSADKINLAPLTGIKALNSSVNLRLSANGKGIDPKKLSFSARLNSINSTITGKPIDDFNTTIAYGNRSYAVKALHLATPFFLLNADGQGVIGKSNHLTFDFKTIDLDNLLDILGYQNYSLSGEMSGEAEGFIKSFDIKAKADISYFKMDSLSLTDALIDIGMQKHDSFIVNVGYQIAKASMDTLAVNGLSGNIKIGFLKEFKSEFPLNAESIDINDKKLKLNLKSENFLTVNDSIVLISKLTADSTRFDSLSTEVITGNLHLTGNDSLTANGFTSAFAKLIDKFEYAPLISAVKAIVKDSLRVNSDFIAKKLKYDSYKIDQLSLNANAGLRDSLYSGNAELSIDSASAADLSIRKIGFDTKFDNELFVNNLNFTANDSVSGFLKTTFLQKKDPVVLIRDLGFSSGDINWTGGSDSSMIVLGKDSLLINHLNFHSDGDQYIIANGIFAFKGNEDLKIGLQGIDIQKMNRMVKTPYLLGGKLNGNIQMAGTSSNPRINAHVQVNGFKLDSVMIDTIAVAFNYLDDVVSTNGRINVGQDQLVAADLKIPFHLSLEDSISFPAPDDPILANLQIDNLDISLFNPLMPIPSLSVSGRLNSHLKIDGPFKHPQIVGNFDLEQGFINDKEYGLSYKNIALKSGIDQDSLYIKTLSVDAGSGNFNANGSISFKQDSLFVPEFVNIHLSSKNFKALDSELIEATINTRLDIKGPVAKPEFTGNLEVLRSNLNADAFLAKFDIVGDTEEDPLLVTALNEQLKADKEKSLIIEKKGYNPLDSMNINGEFRVRIPGNSWVKGKDMNFEVEGDLKAIVEKNLLSLVGELEVKRGYYQLYGKRLDFENGSIKLTGETDINPILDFNVYYSFRNVENELQKLYIVISGRMKEPDITFKLDDEQIDEKEALSYLLFGISTEQMSEGQQATTEISAESYAKTLAYGQLSNLAKNAMQDKLNLDVVEISGNENLDQTSFKVGKYITNNLFVSFQQTFALDKQTTINNPTSFGLEYQILRSLFLKASNENADTGFDLIFKKDFK